jgi:benzoyl-CoA reductase subunit C
MGVEAVLERCREVVEDPHYGVAAAWKQAVPGRKVVGCFPVYAPLEILHAGGTMPLGMFGAGNTIELAHADARFQSFVCSIAKTTLELGMQGRLKLLDAALFSSICDVARNLASVFARNFPDLHVAYLHLPQNMTSPAAIDYTASEYRRLARSLEAALGTTISEAALARSLEMYNRWRNRLRDLYGFRRESPHLLSAVELARVLRAGTLMPIEAHLPLLEGLLAALPSRSGRPRDRLRVLVESAFCEQPPLALLELLEEAGCAIVDDDLITGWRWFVEDVPAAGDPWRSLAESYVTRSTYSSVRHDGPRPRSAGLIRKAREARADAVIFLPAKFCEPALFDYVLYRQALEREGIPHLVIEFEEKMWTFERTRNEVETFVESLLFD